MIILGVCLPLFVLPSHILDPGIAEVVLAWKMIEIVTSSGYHYVLFEGDSLKIVQVLKMDGCCLGRYGQVVNEAKLCLSLFNSWDICHVKRSANNATHCLAKYVLSVCIDHLWIDECPSCI